VTPLARYRSAASRRLKSRIGTTLAISQTATTQDLRQGWISWRDATSGSGRGDVYEPTTALDEYLAHAPRPSAQARSWPEPLRN